MKNGMRGMALAALATTVGCGGGGGANGGSTGLAPEAGQYLEFLGLGRGGNLDPLSLQVGDVVRVVVANYDPAGTRTELPATIEATAGAGQVALSPDGTMRIVGRPPGVFRVTGRFTLSGTTGVVRSDALVPTGSPTTLSGRVAGQSTNRGIVYAQVILFDAFGQVVGGARCFANGAFRVQVPPGATKISIRGETIPTPLYFRSIRYLGEVYTTDDAGCAVPLPPLDFGRENSLPVPLLVPLQTDGPPPPPSGCLGR